MCSSDLPENLLREDSTRADMLALIAENDGPFKHHLDRTKYPGRFRARGDAVDVEAERLEDGWTVSVTAATLVMVAIGPDGTPIPYASPPTIHIDA